MWGFLRYAATATATTLVMAGCSSANHSAAPSRPAELPSGVDLEYVDPGVRPQDGSGGGFVRA